MTTRPTNRAAIYARVSTLDQTTENQLVEVRRYVQTRGWVAQEYVDEGVSGAKDRRPALDRLGRNLKHLITLLEDFEALGVAFVSLAEGIDATTPAGRLQMHILGAIAEFERARIAERVRLGLARVKAQGRRLGRPKIEVTEEQLAAVAGLSVRQAAKRLGISPSTVYRRMTPAKGTRPDA